MYHLRLCTYRFTYVLASTQTPLLTFHTPLDICVFHKLRLHFLGVREYYNVYTYLYFKQRGNVYQQRRSDIPVILRCAYSMPCTYLVSPGDNNYPGVRCPLIGRCIRLHTRTPGKVRRYTMYCQDASIHTYCHFVKLWVNDITRNVTYRGNTPRGICKAYVVYAITHPWM